MGHYYKDDFCFYALLAKPLLEVTSRMQSASFLNSRVILTSATVLAGGFFTSLLRWLKFKLKYNLLTVCDGIFVFYYIKLK